MDNQGEQPIFETINNLETVYTTQSTMYLHRFEAISRRFKELVSQKIDFIARVPAILKFPQEQIVNLGGPKIYACIEQDLVVAVSDGHEPKQLLFVHSDKTKYPAVNLILYNSKFKFEEETSLKYGDNSYQNIILCAIKISMALGINVYALEQGAAFFTQSNLPLDFSCCRELFLLVGILMAIVKKMDADLKCSVDELIEEVHTWDF